MADMMLAMEAGVLEMELEWRKHDQEENLEDSQ